MPAPPPRPSGSPVAPHPKPASGQRVPQRAARPERSWSSCSSYSYSSSSSSSPPPHQRPLPAALLRPRPRSPPAPPRPGFRGPASRGSGLPRVPTATPRPEPAPLPPHLPPEAAGTARRQAGRFAALAPGVSHGARRRRRRSSEATAAGPEPPSEEAEAAAAAAGGAGRGEGEGAGAQAGASPELRAGIPGGSAGGGPHHSACGGGGRGEEREGSCGGGAGPCEPGRSGGLGGSLRRPPATALSRAAALAGPGLGGEEPVAPAGSGVAAAGCDAPGPRSLRNPLPRPVDCADRTMAAPPPPRGGHPSRGGAMVSPGGAAAGARRISWDPGVPLCSEPRRLGGACSSRVPRASRLSALHLPRTFTRASLRSWLRKGSGFQSPVGELCLHPPTETNGTPQAGRGPN